MISETLEKLMSVHGTSGDEYEVSALILKELENIPDCRAYIDKTGNVIAEKKGKNPPERKLLFLAGTDEAGFIITDIDENGFLRFECVGEMDPRAVIGKRVFVGKSKAVGLIGSKAIHLVPKADAEKPADTGDLYIDIGADTKAEAEKLVSLGERAVFESDFCLFGSDFVMGGAAESRICPAILLEMLKEPAEYFYTAAFTVRSQTGGAGAGTAAFAVSPEVAVVVSPVAAADFARSGEKAVCKTGSGAVLSFKDKRTAYDMELFRELSDLAEKSGISYQVCRGIPEKNESALVHRTGEGIKTASVMMPCRYPKTPGAAVKLSDGEAMLKLLSVLKTELCKK